MYILQSLQGQSSGVHDLMSTFKASRLTDPLRCSGNIVFQTIGPNVLNDLSPFLSSLRNSLRKFWRLNLFFIVTIMNRSWLSFWESSFHNCYNHLMKIRQLLYVASFTWVGSLTSHLSGHVQTHQNSRFQNLSSSSVMKSYVGIHLFCSKFFENQSGSGKLTN